MFMDGGHRAAYHRLSASRTNANRWIVVVRSSEPRLGWFKSLSAWQLALLGVVLALVPLALLSWRRSQHELTEAATTDGLTGLGNRRSLAETLGDLVPAASAERPLLLTLYDLDGFKLYNDTYGHPAGDALLSRLGTRLAAAVEGTATAFRMGGDEFCVVAPLTHVDQSLRLASAGAEALREHGEGFTIEASFGSVLLPLDTAAAEEALRVADQRKYAQKSSSRMSASRQSMDVLLRVLSERDSTLGEHVSSVAELAAETALRLELSREEVDEIRRAGALHDVGKLAIPESILQKPGRLDETECQFVRKHPAIGERILGAAPALAKVGTLVRATHERWDGGGYPDKLRGEEIPLGARIVTVCDAFAAMTSERPYRAARTVDEALAELRRCAGSQFDAKVVEAFDAVIEASVADSHVPRLPTASVGEQRT